MFTPSMARGGLYIFAELEFDDGTGDTVWSANEFQQDRNYVRLGGWRLRKLEDYLVSKGEPETLAWWKFKGYGELTLYESYARHAARRWREANPDDPRQVVVIRLKWHRIVFPKPDEDPRTFGDGGPWLIGEFEPDGRLR